MRSGKLFLPILGGKNAKIIFCSLIFLLLVNGCKKDISSEPVAAGETSLEKKKNVGYDIELVATNLVSPLGVEEAPDNSRRLFIFDQAGEIRIVDHKGNLLPDPFLNLKPKMITPNPGYDERGLIGFTFHPNYKSNGKFYVHYQAPPRPGGPTPTTTWNNLSRLSEFTVSADPNKANPASERVIMEWDDPQGNHNGGTVAFGPDGYLYISIGDGGGANDVGPGHVEDWYAFNPGGNGQDITSNLFGDVLRINVNGAHPYTVPNDNPFVGKPGKDEIYAFGFRNPYRFSFDMGGSKKLYLGDAGQVLYEEIDVVEKGKNYGWNVKEGRHCFNANDPDTEAPSCPHTDPLGNKLVDPVIELNHWRNPNGGRATTIIGGNVYRGKSIPELEGKYIFGSFSQNLSAPNAELFISDPSGSATWSFQELILKNRPNDIGFFLKGFGQDRNGEIYIAVSTVLGPSGNSGQVYKLVPVKK